MATLSPLITVADLTEYGYDTVAQSKIPSASARARRFTGQQITAGTSDITLRGPGPWLLPQRPATEITAAIDADGSDVEVELEGQWVTSTVCAPITVTYSHGFDPLPDELIELVCAIAARLSSVSTAMAAGVRSEQAGGEAITYGADAWSGTSGLTSAEQKALRDIYPRWPKSVKLI